MIEWWERTAIALHLDYEVLGNSVGRWLAALAVAVVTAIVLRLTKAVVAGRARDLAARSELGWAQGVLEFITATRLWFLLVVAVYLGYQVLALPAQVLRFVQSLTIIVSLVQTAVWGSAVIRFLTVRWAKQRLESDPASVTMVSTLSFVGKFALWVVVLLLILENVGVQVTTLIAGLGIGGVAVALAAQSFLGDLFASLSIVIDKPFVLGDSITVGELSGTVENIGMKTTRIRSVTGEQVIVPNSDLLKSRIRNFKRMHERRMQFLIGVTYQTPADKLAAIPGMLRGIIEAQTGVRFDRAHFQTLGGSALVFEVVYFIESADFNASMDVQQAVNLEIVRRFAAETIEFAYPTQTLYLRPTVGQGSQDVSFKSNNPPPNHP